MSARVETRYQHTAGSRVRSRPRPPWAAALHLLLLCLPAVTVAAKEAAPAAAQLLSIGYSSLPGNRVQVELTLDGPVQPPRSFTTDNPARVALDFPATTSALKKKTETIGIGAVRSITAVQGKGRTRVVVNLVRMVPFQTRINDNRFIITVESDTAASAGAAPPPAGSTVAVQPFRLEGVDFRRGEQGEGRIITTLSDPATPVNIREEGDKVIVEFAGTSVPEELERRLDVVDFATPVTQVDTFARGNDVRMVISATPPFEHLAYQTDRQFTIELKPISEEELRAAEEAKKDFTGDKLSLTFQDIPVRAALQVIADFTGLNMVVSDTVSGSMSLRLKDVPWDQALDIILRTKGLGMRRHDNIMLVAPAEEIAAREQQELESRKKIVELEPLRSEIIQVNYAKAQDLADLLQSKDSSLLSERGTATVDERTNTLLLRDTASNLDEIRKVVATLDKPVRQVLIESRVVIANDDFTRELGVRFGGTVIKENGSSGIVGLTGSAQGNDGIVNNALTNLQSTGQQFPVSAPSLNDRLSVNLPVASPAGALGLAILGQDYLVDLELSALQAEGRGEVISNPRVITANQKEALIEQGVEIPYQQATSSGATAIAFKKAVLSLKVTPQITPDDRVIMDLRVSKDSVGEVFLGVPSINTREIDTEVLVENGETVVLGGIYEQTRSNEVDKVPLLGDLPFLGALFRTTRNVDDKVELLIFVTPKILKESLGLR
ncbi:MAG TPA: type IV pilus secretin PilQ [Gammaproteobacteria bacterium]|nr:type IV pilus secretin PilQ [Gammaproteobacteria bacterium]